ncbi:MAG: TolC family protein [bacterium]
MNKFWLTTGLLATLLLTGTASAEPISLKETVQYALQHEPSLVQAEANITQAQAGVDSARAQRGVQIGAQAMVGSLDTDFTLAEVSQTPQQIGVQAELPLFTSGALGANIQVAKEQRAIAEQSRNAAQEKTVLDTVSAYSQYWLSLKVKSVSDAKVETLTLRAKETQSRFDQGLATKTDIALAQARLAGAEAEREAAKARVAAAHARFYRITGLLDKEPITIATALDTTPLSNEEAIQKVLAANPDLEQARLAIDIAEERVKSARGQFGPKVTLTARATSGEDLMFLAGDPITEVGAFVQIEMPLYTSGLRSAAIRQSKAARVSAKAGLRDAELRLRETVMSLQGNIAAQELALAAAERAEKAADLAAEGAQREYKAGLRSLIDTLDVEDERRNAEIRTAEASANLLIARATLIALSYQLKEQILQ